VCALQSEYFSEHPHGVNPVQLNDVVFSLHATAACVVTALQCFIYEVSDGVFFGCFYQYPKRVVRLRLLSVSFWFKNCLMLY